MTGVVVVVGAVRYLTLYTALGRLCFLIVNCSVCPSLAYHLMALRCANKMSGVAIAAFRLQAIPLALTPVSPCVLTD